MDASEWDDTLRMNHDSYNMYKQELIAKPTLDFQKDEEEKRKATEDAAQAKQKGGIRVVSSKIDHPLSQKQNSTWKQYYDDKALWEEIEKDVKRTRVELAFFMQAVDPSRNSVADMDRLEMQ